MTHDEMLEVIQAHKDGKTVQFKLGIALGVWQDCVNDHPAWNFSDRDYRIKPTKPLECWVTKPNPIHLDSYRLYESLTDAISCQHAGDTIHHMREVMPEDEWQTEGDPPKQERYLVTIENITGKRGTRYLSWNFTTGWEKLHEWEVIAWKPRPAPWGSEK